MPIRVNTKTGSELFIVDNSDDEWKVVRYLRDWYEISKSIDVATGHFEIGSLLELEGEGHSTIDGKTFHWKPKDIFVVPSWKSVSHTPASDAVLFSCSDRATRETLGFWKRDPGNN